MIPLIFLSALASAKQQISPKIPPIPAQYTASVPKPNDVIAIVNGTQITAKEIEPYLWEWLGPQASEELVNFYILKQACDKAGVTFTEQEVEVRLNDDLKAQQSIKDNDPQASNPKVNARTDLAAHGFPTSRLYLRAELEVMVKKLALHDLKPSEWVKVSTIIFPVGDTTAKGVAKVAMEANQAVKNLKKGVSWVSVLRTTHPSDAMIKTGGLLGWRNLSIFPTIARNELAKSKIGQVTDPVETTNGFQIFKLDAIGASASPKDLSDLQNFYVASKYKELLTKLGQKASIQRFFPKEAGASGSSSSKN